MQKTALRTSRKKLHIIGKLFRFARDDNGGYGAPFPAQLNGYVYSRTIFFVVAI
jgi:hypothetical protein